MAEFCATYLPRLVDQYVRPINDDYSLFDASLLALMGPFCQSSPYFFKYLRSKSPLAASASGIPNALMARLLVFRSAGTFALGDSTSIKALDHVAAVIGLLNAFLAAQVKVREKILDETLRKHAIEALKHLERTYATHARMRKECRRAIGQLEGNPLVLKDAARCRKWLSTWYECAYPSCTRTDNLKTCAR